MPQALSKVKRLENISLHSLRSCTVTSPQNLLSLLEKVFDKHFYSSSIVKDIEHSYELKAVIRTITSDVDLKNEESPGAKFQFVDEPKELQFFSYDQLKKTAQKTKNVYRGKLYGTIQDISCPITESCPDCNGSGICSNCNGEKQVTCPVCEGKTDCISCDGTGVYSCQNCEGSGVCPECDEGWVTCSECYGDGKVRCQDCYGGTYETTCRKCNGSGWYDTGHGSVPCRTCDGTGTFSTSCHTCKGTGFIKCDSCNGEGGWDCEECHGSGKCSHCHGEGGFKCKACDGSGKCGKCKGKGRIWCPECHGEGKCFECKGEKSITCRRCEGTGVYQSYVEYTLTEHNKKKEVFSFDLVEHADIASITGQLCFSGTIYEFFAKRACIYDVDAIEKACHVKKDILKKWINLGANSPFNQDSITNDYLHTHIDLYEVPTTHITFICNTKEYNIHIIGNDMDVYYDRLPGFFEKIFGRIRKIGSK